MEIRHDKEFRDLLPEHTAEEKAELRAQIVEHGGNRDPGVVWKGRGVLVDGYNRKEICDGEGLPFAYVEKEFLNRAAVRNWILANQLGRRNLSDADAALLRGRLYNATKQRGEGNAAAQVAKATGKSPRTIKRDGKKAAAVDSLTRAAAKLAKELPAPLVEQIAKLPKKEQLAAAKLYAGNGSAGDTMTPEATSKPPADQKAAIEKAIGRVARQVVELKNQLGGQSGASVVAALDELKQAVSRWKV